MDEDQASLVTNSWSDLEANESAASVAAFEQIFMQGAVQGIGFLFSSGDDGDELASTGVRQVDYPGSDPYATAVGGTSDATGAPARNRDDCPWRSAPVSRRCDDAARS